MRTRAAQLSERREAILTAAYDLFSVTPFDEVSLARVAARAGVGTKTVLRAFGSKEGLVAQCGEWGSGRESTLRVVSPGDMRAATRVLAARYDQTMDAVRRYVELEDRMPMVGAVLRRARADHRDWLAQVFAPWLPARGAARSRRLAALFGATEIYVWWSWRRRLGMSRALAEATMLEMLEALIARWRD
jgi:AcrR family transcriptional regulator